MRDTDPQNFVQATQNPKKRVVEGVDVEVLRALEQKSVWNIDGQIACKQIGVQNKKGRER